MILHSAPLLPGLVHVPKMVAYPRDSLGNREPLSSHIPFPSLLVSKYRQSIVSIAVDLLYYLFEYRTRDGSRDHSTHEQTIFGRTSSVQFQRIPAVGPHSFDSASDSTKWRASPSSAPASSLFRRKLG